MAWTTPRTWVPGELVTASMMNLHVRDNENYLKAEVDRIDAKNVYCTTRLDSTPQSIPHATWTEINFNTDLHDPFNMHTVGQARVIVKTAGVYVAGAIVLWNHGAGRARYLALMINRGIKWYVSTSNLSASFSFPQHLCMVMGSMTAGQGISVGCYHDAGGPCNVSNAHTMLSVWRIA